MGFVGLGEVVRSSAVTRRILRGRGVYAPVSEASLVSHYWACPSIDFANPGVNAWATKKERLTCCRENFR